MPSWEAFRYESLFSLVSILNLQPGVDATRLTKEELVQFLSSLNLDPLWTLLWLEETHSKVHIDIQMSIADKLTSAAGNCHGAVTKASATTDSDFCWEEVDQGGCFRASLNIAGHDAVFISSLGEDCDAYAANCNLQD